MTTDPLTEATGRAIRAARALVLRQGVVTGANVLGMVLLARAVTPAIFGVVAIALFVQSLAGAVGGASLGAGLVRQEAEPEEADRRSFFTVQLVVCLAVGLLLWVAAPVVTQAYARPPDELWVLRGVALGCLLLPLQGVPALRLERAMDFTRLGAVEAAQAVVLNAGLVLVAWTGAPVSAYGLAFAARGLVGAAVAQVVDPWLPRLAWSRDRVQRIMQFGLPFQGTTLVSIAKDALAPVLVGLTSGAAAVGMINWAQTLAAFPVWTLMPFQRLYMPAFAGLQRDRATLGRLVERTVMVTNGIVAPLAVFTLALSEPITRIVFGDVWLPARPIFVLLWTANLWVATATPLLALVNALGKPRTAFTFAVLWMAATWLLGVPLIVMAGPLGYAVANALVQFINLALFRFAKRLVPMRLLRAAAAPWLAAAAVGIPLAAGAARWPPSGPVALGVVLATAFIGYAGLLIIALVRSWFRRGTNDR